MKVIELNDKRLMDNYSDIADLAIALDHPIYEDDHGILRWVPNPLYKHLSKNGCTINNRECSKRMPDNPFFKDVDMDTEINHYISENDLAVDFHNDKFKVEHLMKHKMNIGYSLSGFAELFTSSVCEEVFYKYEAWDGHWLTYDGDNETPTNLYLAERRIYNG